MSSLYNLGIIYSLIRYIFLQLFSPILQRHVFLLLISPLAVQKLSSLM